MGILFLFIMKFDASLSSACSSSLELSDEVLLLFGRQPEARNAQRLHGIYRKEEEPHNGRPVWQKVASDKPTILCYNEKN